MLPCHFFQICVALMFEATLGKKLLAPEPK